MRYRGIMAPTSHPHIAKIVIDPADLRRLVRLLEGCFERGLTLELVSRALTYSVVEMLDDLGRKHEFRCVTTGFKKYPVLSKVNSACAVLFESIKPTVKATVTVPIPERP
ncbi:MAG TPA: hypothetical protein VIL55_07745 [Naasia sp.]|jgi:hypothetical protein